MHSVLVCLCLPAQPSIAAFISGWFLIAEDSGDDPRVVNISRSWGKHFSHAPFSAPGIKITVHIKQYKSTQNYSHPDLDRRRGALYHPYSVPQGCSWSGPLHIGRCVSRNKNSLPARSVRVTLHCSFLSMRSTSRLWPWKSVWKRWARVATLESQNIGHHVPYATTLILEFPSWPFWMTSSSNTFSVTLFVPHYDLSELHSRLSCYCELAMS